MVMVDIDVFLEAKHHPMMNKVKEWTVASRVLLLQFYSVLKTIPPQVARKMVLLASLIQSNFLKMTQKYKKWH